MVRVVITSMSMAIDRRSHVSGRRYTRRAVWWFHIYTRGMSTCILNTLASCSWTHRAWFLVDIGTEKIYLIFLVTNDSWIFIRTSYACFENHLYIPMCIMERLKLPVDWFLFCLWRVWMNYWGARLELMISITSSGVHRYGATGFRPSLKKVHRTHGICRGMR